DRRPGSGRRLLCRALDLELRGELLPFQEDRLASGVRLLGLLVARQRVDLERPRTRAAVLRGHVHAAGDRDLALVAVDAQVLSLVRRRAAPLELPGLWHHGRGAEGRKEDHLIAVDENEVSHDYRPPIGTASVR